MDAAHDLPDRRESKYELDLERVRALRAKDPEITAAQLAERMGMSRSKVRRIERELGLAPAPAHEGIYSGSVAIFRERKRNAVRRRGARRRR